MAINIIKYSVEFGDLEGATVRLSKLSLKEKLYMISIT